VSFKIGDMVTRLDGPMKNEPMKVVFIHNANTVRVEYESHHGNFREHFSYVEDDLRPYHNGVQTFMEML
jgi:hypothetical protein